MSDKECRFDKAINQILASDDPEEKERVKKLLDSGYRVTNKHIFRQIVRISETQEKFSAFVVDQFRDLHERVQSLENNKADRLTWPWFKMILKGSGKFVVSFVGFLYIVLQITFLILKAVH